MYAIEMKQVTKWTLVVAVNLWTVMGIALWPSNL
jgi:hypothetical protein